MTRDEIVKELEEIESELNNFDVGDTWRMVAPRMMRATAALVQITRQMLQYLPIQ